MVITIFIKGFLMVERYGLILSGKTPNDTGLLCYNAAVIELPPVPDPALYYIVAKTDLKPELAANLVAISLREEHLEILKRSAKYNLPRTPYLVIGDMRSTFSTRVPMCDRALTRIAIEQKGVEPVSRHGGFTPPLEIISRTR
jgi:hypothetical protein